MPKPEPVGKESQIELKPVEREKGETMEEHFARWYDKYFSGMPSAIYRRYGELILGKVQLMKKLPITQGAVLGQVQGNPAGLEFARKIGERFLELHSDVYGTRYRVIAKKAWLPGVFSGTREPIVRFAKR